MIIPNDYGFNEVSSEIDNVKMKNRVNQQNNNRNSKINQPKINSKFGSGKSRLFRKLSKSPDAFQSC